MLHPEIEEVSAMEVQYITIDNVLTNQIYNDLAMMYKNRLMLFVEEQSTVNPNIPLRMIMYAAETIKRYLNDHSEINLFSTAEMELPIIEFYCICTYSPDSKNFPEKLFYQHNQSDLKAEVKMIYSKEVKENIISDYLQFVNGIYHELNITLDKKSKIKPLENYISDCIKKGILTEYLTKHRSEVVSMLDILTDQKTVMERYLNEVKKDAIQQGLQQGIEQGVGLGIEKGKLISILKLVNYQIQSSNMSFADACNHLGLTNQEIEELVKFMEKEEKISK